MIARVLALIAVLAIAPLARAERCGAEASRWLSECSAAEKLSMRLEACPSGVAILRVEDGTKAGLGIEIARGRPAFRAVGAVGLSPIGSFDDWQQEPAERQRVFDAVASCAARTPPTALVAASRDVDVPHASSRPSPPWPMIAAAAAGLLAVLASRRRALADLGKTLGAAALVACVWALTWPFAFFHQNGQGPLWIDFAGSGDAGPYGPGYPQVFGMLVSRSARPDVAVGVAQLLLVALVPIAGYCVARASCRGRLVPTLIAISLCVDPAIVRVARSESYFATVLSLLSVAAAALIAVDSPRRTVRALAVIAASLLVAQAVRIHPLAWVPAAAVPLVVLARPTRSLRKFITVMAIMGVLIAPFVLPTMLQTLRSNLGSAFIPGVIAHLRRHLFVATTAIAVVTVLAITTRFRRRNALAALVLIAVAAVMTNAVRGDAAIVSAAYLHLFAVPAAAAFAAVLAALPSRLAGALIVVIAATHFVRERPHTTLPTDARELQWVTSWRDELPDGARVASVSRAGPRMLVLPLFGRVSRVSIDASGAADLGSGVPSFYYRSSLCAVSEVAEQCLQFERTHRLRPIRSKTLPSLGSLPWLPLPTGELEVTLFAID